MSLGQNKQGDGADAGGQTELHWEWSAPVCVGKGPCARTGHSACLLADNATVLVYGGWDPQASRDSDDVTYFTDAFLLDTVSWEWRAAPAHVAGAIAAKAASHGGVTGHAMEALLLQGSQSTPSFNSEDRVSSASSSQKKLKVRREKVAGAQGGAAAMETSLAVFGGQRGSGERCSDLTLVTL
mmetsp:Transcript_53501/g.99643  ORF Transcript_53501/g.99643 Transcript_53501/m.99643 type:complete len:183 (+) Transcript_53501:665-1213(+)